MVGNRGCEIIFFYCFVVVFMIVINGVGYIIFFFFIICDKFVVFICIGVFFYFMSIIFLVDVIVVIFGCYGVWGVRNEICWIVGCRMKIGILLWEFGWVFLIYI